MSRPSLDLKTMELYGTRAQVPSMGLSPDLVEFCHEHAPFEVSQENLSALIPFLKCGKWEADSKVFCTNETSDGLYLLVKGSVEILIMNHRFATFEAGQTFGEFGVLQGRKRRACCRVTEPATIVYLKRADLFSAEFPSAVASEILLYLGRRMASVLTGKDAYRKIDVLLVQDGGCSPGYNQVTSFIAEYFERAGRHVRIANHGFKSLVSGSHTDFSTLIHNVELYRAVSMIPRVYSSRQLRNEAGASFRTERYSAFKEEKNQRLAAKHIIERGVNVLIAIGGNGTFLGAQALAKYLDPRTQVFFIPSTIDRDVGGTETLGQHTAVEAGANKLRSYLADARTHERAYFIEMMGRQGGFHCLYSCLGSGAHLAVMPGQQQELDLAQVARVVTGRSYTVIAVAEGYARKERAEEKDERKKNMYASEYLREQLREVLIFDKESNKLVSELDESKRKVVCEPFSRELRGAMPNNLDFVLAQRMARAVVNATFDGLSHLMPTVNGDSVGFLKFDDVVTDNTVNPDDIVLADRILHKDAWVTKGGNVVGSPTRRSRVKRSRSVLLYEQQMHALDVSSPSARADTPPNP
jgi:6-phosphofructokinase